jgi:methyl-accepting chemotaxis protein
MNVFMQVADIQTEDMLGMFERTPRFVKRYGDIAGMIGEIQNAAKGAVAQMQQVVVQVESGQALAQDAGARIEGIQNGSDKAAEAIQEISSALKEQSTASQEIARHVESVAQMTDENNAAAATTAASAEQVHQLAEGIVKKLGQFKVLTNAS